MLVLEGKVSVSMTHRPSSPPSSTSPPSSKESSVVVMERRWVVLKHEKLDIYDKKINISRQKLLSVVLTSEIKDRTGVYIENPDTKELFSQEDHYVKWSTAFKSIFAPVSRSRANTAPVSPPKPNEQQDTNNKNINNSPEQTNDNTITNTNTNINTNNTNGNNNNNINTTGQEPYVPLVTLVTPSEPGPALPTKPSHLSPRHTVAVSNPKLVSSSSIHHSSAPPGKIIPQRDGTIDVTLTDDLEMLKKEVLHLRRQNAVLAQERDSLVSILTLEKDFVRDRQNKLDSWEHFARLIVFKAVCNQNKSESLKATLNRILASNLPSIKSVKINRMEVVLVNLPTKFEESPNFGLSNYDENTGIATFNFKWYPQDCNITLQIDGSKKIGGAIPISFKVSIDLLSKLKLKGALLLSKGEGNQFLISLPQLPELTFASPTKLQIGEFFDVSSFAIVQKVVENAVFNSLKKNLVQPVWKEA